MKELTEKQENYKKIIFGQVEDNKKWAQRKIDRDYHVEEFGKMIRNIEKIFNFNWDKENFDYLVRLNNRVGYFPDGVGSQKHLGVEYFKDNNFLNLEY